MKKSIITLLTVLTATQFAFAKNQINDLIPSITALDSPEAVLGKTDRAIRSIYQRLDLEQLQLQINSTTNEIKREIVTERKTNKTKTSLGAKLSLLFIGGSANYDSKSKSRLDITQVVTANARELQAQESRAVQDLANLKKNLTRLITDHEQELVLLKELGMIQAAAVYDMIRNQQDVPWQQVNETLKMAQEINFSGAQVLTRCVTTHHAASTSYNKSSESGGFRLRLLFFSFGMSGSDKQQSYHRKYAYTEKQCSSSTNTVKVTANDTVFAVNLSLLDMQLEKWIKTIDAAQVFNAQAPEFPTWGSPYYN